MTKALTFNNVQLVPVIRNNQPWIKSADLAKALGYKSEKAVSKVYSRNSDEFSNDMSVVSNLGTTGKPNLVRIFSLRGCHLLAMFARTPVAKAFRKWILDVLDSIADGTIKPVSETITPEQQCTLQDIVRAKVEAIPEEQRIGCFPHIWKRFNSHFRIAKYSQLPQARMGEAIAYLTQLEVATKAIEASKSAPAIRTVKRSCGLKNYLDYIEEEARILYDELTKAGGPGSLFLALDQHSHNVPLSLYQELLLQSVHNYTNMALTGAKLLLDGIKGCKGIKQHNLL